MKKSKELSQFEDFKSHLGTHRGIPLNPDLEKIIQPYLPCDLLKAPVLKSRYLLDVPKWFGDIFEAIFGYIWLDQHQSLPRFWNTLKPLLKPLMELEAGEQTFKNLNPRKHCEKEGKVTEKVEKLTEKLFNDDYNRKDDQKLWIRQKGGLREADRIHIDKYVCKLELKKHGQDVRFIL